MRRTMGWPFTRAATSGSGLGSGVTRSISGGAPGSDVRDADGAAVAAGGPFDALRPPEHAPAAIAATAGISAPHRVRRNPTSGNESGGAGPPRPGTLVLPRREVKRRGGPRRRPG